MAETAPNPETSAQPDAPQEVNDTTTATVEPSDVGEELGPEVKMPEFASLKERVVPGGNSMERFFDVRVNVWAELGRVEIPLGELMQLGEGSVLKLNRPVGEPVDLVSQGVKLARGEVVVVDDSFAIRIREIMSSEK